MKRVAVIGCGSTGLGTLGHLSSREGVEEMVGYERQTAVGGEWNYSSDTDYKDGVRPSAIYNSLRLNTDKQCSSFPGFPFEEDVPCWPTHCQMKNYLEDYASRLNLRKYIKFGVNVEHVAPVNTNGETQWLVESRHLVTGQIEQQRFDAVVICTGIFQNPVLPIGIDEYQGPSIHSCQYREPSAYRGKTLLVIGNGPSSWDISSEIANVAKRVYVSKLGDMPPMIVPDNAQFVGAVEEFRKNSVVLEDGVELEVEAILMCTGYRQNYPFLDSSCHVSIRQGVTYPLYNLMVHPEYPTSLFFNGMTYIDAHVPVISFIAKVIGNLITGDAVPPSRQHMERTIEEEFRRYEKECQPPRDMLKLGSRQDEFLRALALLGGIKNIPNLPTFKEIIKIIDSNKFHLLRNHVFVLNEDGSCKVMEEANS